MIQYGVLVVPPRTCCDSLPDKPSECGLDVSDGGLVTVCSTKSAIDEMKKTLEEKQIDTSPLVTAKHVVDKMKDELGCKTEKCVLTNPELSKTEKMISGRFNYKVLQDGVKTLKKEIASMKKLID